MPTLGNYQPIAPPPGSYESALFYNLFAFLDEVAQEDRNRTLAKVRRAVLGKSIEDAVFVQELVSRLLLSIAPAVEIINGATLFYLHLSEEREVSPC